MNNDHKALIAEAREMRKVWATHEWEHKLVSRLADALEAVPVDRAEVEAQPLEAAADSYLCVNPHCGVVAFEVNIMGICPACHMAGARASEIREGQA